MASVGKVGIRAFGGDIIVPAGARMGTELILVIAALGAVDGNLAVIDLIAADVGQDSSCLEVVRFICFENDMTAAAALVMGAVAVIYIFTLNIVVTVAAGRIRTFSAVSVILSERLSGL